MPNDENEMPFKVRVSKFRHVFGTPYREQDCYKNIPITRNAHDGSFCAVNSKFLAIVTETSGGGSFLVLLLAEVGRVDVDHPRITGHRGPVVDLKFNPFNDNEIASCSDDGTVKVWFLPNEGLKVDTYQWKVDLHGHQRRVDYIEWHPTAQNLILSAGLDHQVVLWNVERAEPIQVYRCHPDAIQSITWNRNGSLFATTCKDKHIRVIEARTGRILSKGIAHQGPKTSKVVFLGDSNRLLSTGFGKQFERQIAIWNSNDLSKPITVDTVDFSAGAVIPFYDHDTRMIYLAGKGDGNIRFYELSDQGEPILHYLSEYKSSSPQRCLGVMPKIGLDVTRNEIMRFYKLSAISSVCEPISMIVPRKTEAFQIDIYPDTPGPYPALSPDEWIAGIDRDPILVSMKDRVEGTNMPKITTYRTIDSNASTPILSHRGTPQRTVQPPVAEVAPTPKTNPLDQSPPSPILIEKLALNLQQQPQQPQQQPQSPSSTPAKGLRKIESLKMPATSTEFHHVRDEVVPLFNSSPISTPKSVQAPTSPRKDGESTSKVTPDKNSTPPPSDTVAQSTYRKPKSTFKQFQVPKSLDLTRSTPDLSALVEINKKEEDASSSSLENLYHTYSSKTLPEKRPPGSILKRRKQPASTTVITPVSTKLSPVKSVEEPVYVSSASVPLQNLNLRSTQSMIRDPSTTISDRDKFQNHISQLQQQRHIHSPSGSNLGTNRRPVEVKKKVWSVDALEQQPQPQQTPTNLTNGAGHHTQNQQHSNGIDYRQAYLKQQEEVQSLRELMIVKDNRIRLLEDELSLLRGQHELNDCESKQ